MINWHKFSERQPGKGCYYLICRSSLLNYYRVVYLRKGCTYCPEEYWAEINPPGTFCKNCNPSTMYPGKLILTDKKGKCQNCGKQFTKEPPMPENLLCKNCRWIGPVDHRDPDYKRVLCQEPRAPRSLVDGNPDAGAMCWCLRQVRPKTCGPEGRWFEAKGEVSSRNIVKGHAHALMALLEGGPPYNSAFTAGEWQILLGLLERLYS